MHYPIFQIQQLKVFTHFLDALCTLLLGGFAPGYTFVGAVFVASISRIDFLVKVESVHFWPKADILCRRKIG